MKALIVGATGYTGQLLLTLLAHHPHITQIGATSTSVPHTPITNPALIKSNKSVHPHYISMDNIQEQYDVVFSALPHGSSIPTYLTLLRLGSAHEHKTEEHTSAHPTLPHAHPLNQGPSTSGAHATETHPFVYIDLSADFRFSNIDTYVQIYGQDGNNAVQKNTAVIKAMHTAVYGLSEFQRDALAQTHVIACPGCYPTSILIPLIPVLRHCAPSASIAITSISGISGAGSRPKKHALYSERTESLYPYAIGRTHRHYFEIKDQLEKTAHCTANFTFTPVLAPLKQGILSIMHIPLQSHDISRAVEAVRAQYIDESFVSVVLEESIDTALVRNTNNIIMSIHQEHDAIIITSVIDNLWKGAAGQAIQNFNIRFGFPETTGLEYFAL